MTESIKTNDRVQEISREYLDFYLEYFPTLGTMLGIYDYDDKLDSMTPEKIGEIIGKIKEFQNKLGGLDYESLSREQKTDYRLLKSEFHKSLRSFETETEYALDPSMYPSSCFGAVQMILFRHRDRIEEKVGDLFSRLREIPRVLREGKCLLTQPPKLFVESAIETTDSGKILFEESLEILFTGKLEKYRDEYEKLKGQVLDGLDDYKKFLQEELILRSVPGFAIGREAFEDRLHNDDFLEENADEIEEIGLRFYREMDKELHKMAESIEPGTPWVEIIRKHKKDHPAPENMIEEYRKVTNKARDYCLEHNLVSFPPDEKLEIIFTPPSERHLIPWAAFFPCAHFDRSTAGHSLVTPPNKEFPPEKQELQMQEHNYHKMILNSIHEAYPGHHLQLTWARENPSLIRALSMSSLFAEGWALYTEELMRDLGYIKDPLDILFQLKDKAWRAARIIIDVGLHVKGMTMDEAITMLTDTIGYSKYAALTEVKRYAHSPTQPMSYLTGLTKILKMRDKFREKYPDSPLREFHDRMMKAGSLPPRLMEEEIGLI